MEISPLYIATSFTRLEDTNKFSSLAIKKIVSISDASLLLIDASVISYSKSLTALNPLIIKEIL